MVPPYRNPSSQLDHAMWEKYNVVTNEARGGGGEYEVQVYTLHSGLECRISKEMQKYGIVDNELVKKYARSCPKFSIAQFLFPSNATRHARIQ